MGFCKINFRRFFFYSAYFTTNVLGFFNKVKKCVLFGIAINLSKMVAMAIHFTRLWLLLVSMTGAYKMAYRCQTVQQNCSHINGFVGEGRLEGVATLLNRISAIVYPHLL